MKKFFKWLWRGCKETGIAIGQFFKGVAREAKRVRWPNAKSMVENTVTVVVFSAFFAIFFSASFTIVQAILRALGYFN